MASPSEAKTFSGDPTEDPSGTQTGTHHKASSDDDDENAFIRRWESQKRRLIKLRLRMDSLTARVESMEERLTKMEFPEVIVKMDRPRSKDIVPDHVQGEEKEMKSMSLL